MAATDARITFCGHLHRPALYSMSITAKMTNFVPTTGVPVQLLGNRHWLAVVGSVGQPRDGDPRAGFLLFDSEEWKVSFYRVPYDHAGAARKIRAAGLPERLALRIERGV